MVRRYRDVATGTILGQGVEEVYFCDECGEQREKGNLIDLSLRGVPYGMFCSTCLVSEDVIQADITEDGEEVIFINDAEGKEIEFPLDSGSDLHV